PRKPWPASAEPLRLGEDMDTTICCPNGHPLGPSGSLSPRPTHCPVCGVVLLSGPGVSPRISPQDETEVLPNVPPSVPGADAPFTASKTQAPSGSDTQVLNPSGGAPAHSSPARIALPDAKTEELPAAENQSPEQSSSEDNGSEPPLEPQYGFAGVYYGLAWHYFKVAGLLVAVLLLAVAAAVRLYRQTNPPHWLVLATEMVEGLVVLGLSLAILVSPMLGVVGSIRCMTVPRDARNSRTMIMGATGLELVSLLLLSVGVVHGLVGWYFSPLLNEGGAGFRETLGPALNWLVEHALILGLLANLGALSFFLLFVEQLNRYFRDRTSAAEAFALLGRTWAVAAGWVVVGTLVSLHVWLGQNRHRFDPSISLGVGLFVIITLPLALWASIWLLRGMLDLVSSLRHLIWMRTT
ncbi:MAG: hypothetical protein NZM31_07660, partial [Gemmatales bacterium]|nr:hypothetical protein [Gemmatales bacterium]MDW8386871.1 hypothetical protein [Gemmatales bacterium]